MSWRSTRISDVLFDARSGFASGKNEEDGILQIRMNNLTRDGTLDYSKTRRVPSPKRNLGNLLLQPGDVLFNATNSSDLVGKTAYFDTADEPTTFSNHFIRLRPNDARLVGRYLTRWLQFQFNRKLFSHIAKKWINQATVSREALLSLDIPLPPVTEQWRVATILDTADALRIGRREALVQLDKFTEATFFDMFGDPSSSKGETSTTHLGGIARLYAGGTLPRGEPRGHQNAGYMLLKVADLNLEGNETHICTSHEWSAHPGARSATCPPDSVVIPKRGGAIGTNKKRITSQWSVLDPNLMGIAPIDDKVDIHYLYWWFRQLDLLSITSGSSVPQLNKRDLSPLHIQTPPLDLQREFGRRVEVGERLKAQHRRHLAELDALFASLQYRAFRGEL